MWTTYFTAKAYQNICEFYQVSRKVVNDLYGQLRFLEQNGIPEDALLVSDLYDVAGQEVEGYLAGLGRFVLTISCEGPNSLVVWEIQIKIIDS